MYGVWHCKAKRRPAKVQDLWRCLCTEVTWGCSILLRRSILSDKWPARCPFCVWVWAILSQNLHPHYYLSRYDWAKSKCDAPSNSTAKNRCFAKLLEKIYSPLKSGQGFVLSDLRDNVNGFRDSTETFSNRDIRLFLESHYSQDLNISRPTEANKCDSSW